MSAAMQLNPRPRCPACGTDCGRDERFALLDSLILAGWGDVPWRVIEEAMHQNSGPLPDPPLVVEDEPEPEPEPIEPPISRAVVQRHQAETQRDRVFQLMRERGVSNSMDIAQALGLPLRRVADHLRFLWVQKRIEKCGYLKMPGQGGKAIVYRMADASPLGPRKRGITSLAKLDYEKAEEIRRKAAAGATAAELAREYGISPRTVGSVTQGLRWRKKQAGTPSVHGGGSLKICDNKEDGAEKCANMSRPLTTTERTFSRG